MPGRIPPPAGGGAAAPWRWPVNFEPVVTQPFGVNPDRYRQWGLLGHEGIDLRAPTGTEALAVADGVVIFVGHPAGHAYGYHIRLHVTGPDGVLYEVVYAHLLDGSARVGVGDRVSRGQVIALCDETGRAIGAHLHFGVRPASGADYNNGYAGYIDPAPFILPPNLS